MTLDTKISIVHNIIDTLELSNKMPDLISQLRAAKDARNREAHSVITVNVEALVGSVEDQGESRPWKSMRTTRRGRQEQAANPIELEREIALVRLAYFGVGRLAVAVLAVEAGRDIDQTLANFDELNSVGATTPSIIPVINDVDGLLLSYHELVERA
jgi:hypothetical protein